MKYTISPDRSRLEIIADSNERAELSRQAATCGIQSDEALHDWLESLVCNSELEWINPADTGDLTSAPMLGILSTPEFKRHNIETVRNLRNRINSCDTHGLMVSHVAERWAFMDYQVRSVLEDLRDNGKAVFVS